MTDDDFPNLRESEAAKLLGYSPRTLRSWRDRGTGPRYYVHGARSVRYLRADLLEFALRDPVDAALVVLARFPNEIGKRHK